MIQNALCDDNPDHFHHAASLLEEAGLSPKPEIESFSTAAALLKSLVAGAYTPDIAVLDIRLEDMDGFSLAREINQKAPACRIIYLTSCPDYAPDAYLTRHVWFVQKERAGEYLVPAVRRAISGMQIAGPENVLSFPSRGKIFVVPIKDVLYIDRVGRKARIVCRSVEQLVTQSPALLIPAALASRMIRCHQSCWVNVSHITALDRSEFVLDNQTRIPISRTYRDAAEKRSSVALSKISLTALNSKSPAGSSAIVSPRERRGLKRMCRQTIHIA